MDATISPGWAARVPETQTISQTVSDAVRDGHLLRLNYHHFLRVVQPRSIHTDEDGHVVLVAVQLSGGCETGQAFGLKRFRVDQIDGADILVEHD